MNYTRAQLDAILDELVPTGYQIAFHCNGDVGFDVVLDAYARALAKFNPLGSDHRWRVEHLGAARKDQFERAAALGVTCSLSPFQYIYWGDLLDGVMFDSAYGAQWQRVRDAFEAGVVPSYHNDGSVTPPNQLLNVAQTVTRRTISGKEAEEVGYVTKTVPEEDLETEVHGLASAISVLPRDAIVMGKVARRHMSDRMGLSTLKEVITYHTLSTNISYTPDERDLMFIRDREGMGEREAFHKMHEKYEEALNKTKYFQSYDPRKK